LGLRVIRHGACSPCAVPLQLLPRVPQHVSEAGGYASPTDRSVQAEYDSSAQRILTSCIRFFIADLTHIVQALDTAIRLACDRAEPSPAAIGGSSVVASSSLTNDVSPSSRGGNVGLLFGGWWNVRSAYFSVFSRAALP
jgi:hypothetical protein